MHLFNKKNILKTDLLQGITDIHTHILPGIDDGVHSFNASVKSLEYLKEIGIHKIYMTPHIMEDFPQNNSDSLQTCFNEFINDNNVDIKLELAAEYMIDSKFTDHLKKGLLSMNGHHVLVETSYLFPPVDFTNQLYNITLENYIPIIAHPERYQYMDRKEYFLLKEKNYKLQLNLLSLCGYYGKNIQTRAEFLLKNDLYDFVGSDFHNLHHFKRGLNKMSLSTSQIKKLRLLAKNNESL